MNIARDLYYFLIHLSWKRFFGLIFFLFLFINIFFANLFYFAPNSLNLENPSWWDCFFFSVQTFSTIGYGVLSPQSFLANILVTFEAALGLISSAIITGIVFSKFSRPKSRILFSNNILVQKINNKKVLSFRVGNQRANDLVDVEMIVTALIQEVTEEGIKIARMNELKLLRNRSPFFSLSWMIFHPLDEHSPLSKLIENNQVDSSLISISALLIGHDGTYSQTIYAKNMYSKEDIVFDRYFEDVINVNKANMNVVDYSKFNQLKPVN
ncbi:MAG: ATP-sensitive inward rectifier potassium channel 10 [Bdellovibrionales bacterium CG12_big_fil_rev_8_21_14_0_65_38_15]|nr:MAG: ATP-sensitive inward rectifier potassium channel 10 [Bdellovibrionales bacterium CG22_combo_CG10-13_8_21_14_all_38_13]PIQ57410.1 MAG: ATP-sensitive inward rectifier potassium channel 10 [Bdellovibrionales bacterium CG12_big_fil_rev_8_21_14_0_65_38_15]PIR31130.1 MAG: ATP-sensitive inward rectifier potassium channel 10 [Bdellovibrionales bacterium CG11_big_fil_rev_8_21_14_0_20_38_13]